jgi:hypothetical protein
MKGFVINRSNIVSNGYKECGQIPLLKSIVPIVSLFSGD